MESPPKAADAPQSGSHSGANSGANGRPGYFVRAGQGSVHGIFPGVQIETVAGERMMLSLVNLEPGSEVLEHSHPHEQMGILISGQLEFTIDNVTETLVPGDFWRIPGGVPHRVRPVGGKAVALDVFHPIRDDYL